MSETTRVVNPATEETLAVVAAHGADEVDRAVARGMEVGSAWRAVAPADRARLLRRFAARVEEHGEELALLETENVGKPIGESRDEVGMVAEVLYFYAGAVDKHRGATVPVAGGVDMTFHEPLGVVAAIVPWNFPMAITSWKVGPALATGNTIVVKPAESTPLTARRLADLALEAGLPEGVFQVVTGPGSVVGTRLVEHPDVAKVAFTGSTEVGRQVMARAAGTIKRLTLELGGKSASIVFADADVERAAAATPGGVFANAGQDCCARSRALVQRPVFDRFLARLDEAVRDWTVGDPTDPATRMGPLASDAHRQVVQGFLAPGMGEPDGGPVAVRIAGTVPGGPGYWFPPTVVAPARAEWRLAREEIFGPVRGGHPLRRRGGGRSPGQRHALRALRLHLDQRQRPCPPDGPGGSVRESLGEFQQLGTGPDQLRRDEAVGIRTRARARGPGLVHGREERLRVHVGLSGRRHRRVALTQRSELVAVVTGASRGLGAGLAETFAGRGVRLGLCARTPPPRPPGAADAVTGSVDVTDADALDRFALTTVERFGHIDLWVNNAGVLEPIGPLVDADLETAHHNIDVNVLGAVYGSAIFARHVRARPGRGVLVNMVSGAAARPYEGWAAYCASKAAVAMLTEVVAREERSHGLRAFALAPGVVDTAMQALIRSSGPDDFPEGDRFRRLAAEGRLHHPSQVARFILDRLVDGSGTSGDRDDLPVQVRVPDESPGH